MSRKNAVTYARSATFGNSIHEQSQRCAIFAVQKGYRVLSEYVDEGVSDMTLDREGLNKLRAKLKTGGVDVLLIVGLSRLTRDSKQLRELLDEFRASNVTIELVH